MRKFLIGFLLSILMVFPVFAENTPCGPGTGPYILLEYIESTGTQWIDTGIVANQDTRIVTRARFNSVVNDKTFIFGAGASYGISAFEGYVWDGKIEFNYRNGVAFGSVVNVGDVIDIDFNKNIITYSINGIQQPTITRSYGVFNSPGTMYLFAINRGKPRVGLTNMYKTQIYDNDTLVRDFVPVRRNSDGAIGMYDIVSGEFFGNSGTGEFIAGPVVGRVVGVCNVCGTGYYNSIGNDTLCIACPTGYNATGDNATDHDEISDCTITCPAGQYVAEPNGECVPVPAGYYAPNEHNVGYDQISSDVGGILQCPIGQTTSYHGASCRDICGVGTEPYTLLEYIESTGTQWIDTGIVANQDTRIVTRARFNSVVNDKASIFGAGASAYSSTFEGYVWNGKIEFNYRNGVAFGSVVNVGDVIDIDFNKNIITYSINGIQQPTITRSYGVFNSPGTMYLFAINRGKPIVGLTNMYKTQIYDNDTLVRDFVPVRRNSDGAIGMYDIVSGEFFGNSGTGEFIAGPVVGWVVGACNVCGTGYYNSIGNDTLCIACPSGLVSPMGSVDAGSCGRKIHVGDEIIYLRSVKKTTPSLNFDIDNDGVPDFFGNATLQRTPINSTSQHFLHVGDYYIYDDTVTPEK